MLFVCVCVCVCVCVVSVAITLAITVILGGIEIAYSPPIPNPKFIDEMADP